MARSRESLSSQAAAIGMNLTPARNTSRTKSMSVSGHSAIGTAARSVWLLWSIATCAGCAAQQKPPPPPVLAAATAIPGVGDVLPVYIEVAQAQGAAATVYREDICAVVENDDKCVPALDLEDAGRMAGGMDKLAAALADENAGVAIGRSVLVPSVAGMAAGLKFGSEMGQGGAGVFMLGTAAGVATGIARGTYLAASSEARHLDQVASHSLGSRVKWNWYVPASGFVCFPAGKYSRIQIEAITNNSAVSLSLQWPASSQKSFDVQYLQPQTSELSPGSFPAANDESRAR